MYWFLYVHVCPKAVLIAVHLVTHWTCGLGGDSGLAVVAGHVHVETVLILHDTVTEVTAQPGKV